MSNDKSIMQSSQSGIDAVNRVLRAQLNQQNETLEKYNELSWFLHNHIETHMEYQKIR